MTDQERNAPIERDGYAWGEVLAWEGFIESEKTGRTPNPYELRKRLVPSFVEDIKAVRTLVESQRPKPPDTPKP